MTSQCSFIKVNGIQCKLQTRNTICHKHINLYTIQQEKHEQELEQNKINQELIKLKTYEKNVKTQIKALTEKKNKISTLKENLEDAIKNIENLEKDNIELEKQNNQIEENYIALKKQNNILQQENADLKKISKSYDSVCKFEKMKIDLRNLTNSKFFNIDTLVEDAKLQTKIKELFKCNGTELRKRYWYLQKKRVEFCHPYEYTSISL